MPLDGGGLLAFALLRRLFVELAAAQLGQNAGLLAGALEAAQRGVEIFVFFNANTGHKASNLWSKNSPALGRDGAAHYTADLPGNPSPLEAVLRYHAPLMNVLGIETSCDETGVAVYSLERGLLSSALHSQVDLHAVYGGVVPEIASRDHVRRLLPLVDQVLLEAGIERPDAVAYTAGPGLVGALMVGGGLANGLALAWGCPVVPVHHMEGHLLAPMLEDDKPPFPFLALLVSGGHSMLVSVAGVGRYELLGTTLDDAVGEAFDKTAKLLGLGYPGGPALAALAESGDDTALDLPRPMLNRPGFDFSFSGLKTAVMVEVRRLQDAGRLDASRADVAASFQRAAVDTLIGRALQAAAHFGFERIVIAGGVGANRLLRREMAARFPGRVYYPRMAFCTDNGAMIAVAGGMRLADACEAGDIRALARWPLASLGRPGALAGAA